jgi:hypothetical protein
MPQRLYPSDYFTEQIEQPQKLVTETSVIPNWVPILLGICIVLMGAITLYALSLNRKEKIVQRERPPLI